MFQPSFNKGSVLKQNMLEALRDYPYIVLEMEYSEYGSGIISGLDVCPIGDDMFQIAPGLLKVDGKIYILSEILTIKQEEETHYVYLIIQNTDNPDGKDIELTCEQTVKPKDDAFELFRYTKNADMFVYKDIRELFNGPMNRINQIFCKFAIVGGNTLHPDYFRLFAKEILESTNASISDVAFAYQCLNGINNIGVIKQYFNDVVSNSDVIERMEKVLNRLSMDNNIQKSQSEKLEKPRKMVIS